MLTLTGKGAGREAREGRLTMSLCRRGMPGVPDLVFLLVLVAVLIGGRTGFLNDPGTFWHLRLGREIARTGVVPRIDTLTYTRAGTVWVDQSWAFDLGLATLVDRWGWSAAVAATAIGLAAIYGALARGLLLNPYGVGLYGHVAGVLVTSRVTDLISEYQPSPFGKAEARVLEWVVLALIALPVVSKARPTRYDLAHALVWLHFALTTIRH